jgi:ribosome-associated protein
LFLLPLKRTLPLRAFIAKEVDITALDIALLAREACLDKKAENVRLLDVVGVSDLCDYILVVSGQTPPQIKAIGREIEHRLKEKSIPCGHRSGDSECGWMVLDYLNVVIHVFLPRTRAYYAIEDLWARSRPVP